MFHVEPRLFKKKQEGFVAPTAINLIENIRFNTGDLGNKEIKFWKLLNRSQFGKLLLYRSLVQVLTVHMGKSLIYIVPPKLKATI